MEAALKSKAYVVGVDVDQHYIGEKAVAENGYNPFVTSAMKGLKEATVSALGKFFDGTWADIGGKVETLNLQAGDYVGLPSITSSSRISAPARSPCLRRSRITRPWMPA